MKWIIFLSSHWSRYHNVGKRGFKVLLHHENIRIKSSLILLTKKKMKVKKETKPSSRYNTNVYSTFDNFHIWSTIISQTNFGAQQQYLFIETQHLLPSPRLFSMVFKHPSGQELPMKQNGAIPYHLHRASFGWGTILKIKRTTIVLVIIDEVIDR